MTDSVGIIETRSIASAAEILNQILDNNKIELVNIEFPGEGNVTVFLYGEYSLMKRAIESAEKISSQFLSYFSSKIITKPDEKLYELLNLKRKIIEKPKVQPLIKKERLKSKPESTENIVKVNDDVGNSVDKKISLELPGEKTEEHTVVAETSKDVPDTNKFEKRIRVKKEISAPKEIVPVKRQKIRLDNPTIAKLRLEALGKTNPADINENNLNLEIENNGNSHLTIQQLEELNVHKLRRYARGFTGFPIKGREISRANRDELLNHFKELI